MFVFRIGLVQDLNLLCLGGYVGIKVVLNFILAMKNETEFNVLTEIANFLKTVCNMFWQNENIVKNVHTIISVIFEPLFHTFGFDNVTGETTKQQELRSLVLSMLSNAGYEP